MPRGYLKHNKQINRKKSRGNATHSSSWADPYQGRSPSANKFNSLLEEDFVIDTVTNNRAAVSAPKNGHKTVQYPVSECPICFEKEHVISLSKICKWHDAACGKCLRRIYVTDAQDESKGMKSYPLRCFHPQCRRPVHLGQLEKHGLICSPVETRMHHTLTALSKANCRMDARVVYCPHCDVPRVFFRENILHKKDRTYPCKSCRKTYLVSPDYATIRALERLGMDKVGDNDGWARCPNCSILISKGSGCGWMHCGHCSYDFRWYEEIERRPLLARPRDSDIYLWW